MSAKDVTDVDVAIGIRIRIRDRRKTLSMSQTTLADASGITFQQVQKYEKGVNRISAARLVLIAKALDVHVMHLLEEPTEIPALSADALRAAQLVDGIRDRHRRTRVVDVISLVVLLPPRGAPA